ncbi:fatty acid CoA ligase FadD9 [Nocardia tenerifensis]|uniref:Carboxylic acid reductase n=3 Tax=Nocardia tenerifensis TaxID=228006 RepID=A0A318K9K9_9NOCA|nr:carboxylic acid reductase [Nocardia tenerifensis]PXX70756.1 fatty acid CoA ligase FadD9 [Nocardia tenerifensis]
MAVDARDERLRSRIARLFAEDEQVKAARPSEAVSAAACAPDLRLAQVVAAIMEGYAERPAVGQRSVEVVTDDATGARTLRLLPAFETLTYGELWQRVRAVAAAWHGDSETPLRAGDFVAILGFTSIDYATLDFATIHLGAVSVPLQAGAAVPQLTAILTETAPRVLASTPEYLDTAVDCLLAGAAPERLVIFDYHPADDAQRAAVESARRRLAEAGRPVHVETLDEVRERGAALPQAPLFVPDPDDDPLALLIYTSGSTGTPKGAMYPEHLARAMWQGTPPGVGINLNYMPMSHIAGRLSFIGVLARGGTAYFAAKSDMSTLFEDIALARPTEIFFVPRVCDMIFQRYRSEMDRRSGADADPAALDREVKAELREQFLGGRFLGAIVGSAPVSAEMRAFMESVLDVRLHDGYGSTEAGARILMDNRIQRPPVTDYKLVDVPELGYFRTDQPHPRGELLVKAVTQIPGYFKRPEITAEVFDEDGFYKTGDIVAELGPDELVYVDRRNNVLKLSQGEFVTVANLEAVYATSPLIRQIFVYGSSERAYLLAVIVPTEAALREHDPETLKTALAESIQELAKAADLQSYEIPRDFVIEPEPFTVANGLLSGISKLLRPKLKQRYGARLEQIYAEHAARQSDELVALRRAAAERPVLDTVGDAARALLGIAAADLRPDAHFTDLGGDSLSALSFSNLLTDAFGVEVPVGVIISPANTLGEIAKYIEAERDSGAKRPTYSSVHGGGARISAAELTLDKFIDARTLAAATTIPAAPAPARTVLLTGANGYLGRFLCLEWLERLEQTGGTLICVVRGSDAAAARRRLDAAFDSGDPELLAHYRDLAERRLEVLAGDIGDPNLGVDEPTWRRLAETVDLIVHAAALVNHVLPYGQLFGPNVVGTAEIIRLAITARRKPVTYLSTVAVADQVDPSVFQEDSDVREMSAVRAVNEGYANGYGNSKWAGEVLLREAHDLCGLPVAVFRSDMILAHSKYAGQLNVQDMFTRLVLSLVATGVAPYSFYVTDAAGKRRRAHYEGLPADFTAAAITTLGGKAVGDFHTYDVLNPHDDGVSLDVFVDWLIESGVPIQRIADYDDWFHRFETAIRALPEAQRQASVLPLLRAYRVQRPPIPGSPLPAKKFQAAVQTANVGGEHDIPHLSAALIEKYVSDLRLLKLL